ncbi:HAD family hydrolase [Planctomycetota bacterium]
MDISTYKHIIWDWNGTLIDDVWLCVEIVNELLFRRNKEPIILQQYRQRYDLPVKNFYEKVGFDFSEGSFEKIGAEFLKIYQSRQYECTLQNGAVEMLNFFEQAGLFQSVLSAYQKNRLQQALEHFGIQHYFTHICGRIDDFATGKIDNANDLIREFHCPAEKVLLIGDTVHDFKVAEKTGVDCILLSIGHHTPERLQSCNVPVVDSLANIMELLT